MIVVRDITKRFGGSVAVDGVSLEIPEGSITGLIGPNGAGKTTLFNVIAGVHAPTSGTVTMNGEDVTGLAPHVLFGKGLLRTFQIAQEFGSMSVLENLMTVPAGQRGETLWNCWIRRKEIAQDEARLKAKAEEVLAFLSLTPLRDEKARNLSGGQKKLLELGRTMMVDAKIVFLDEVGAGVNRTLLGTIAEAIVRLNRERGYTFCVIEHDMDFIARLCHSVIVMEQGRVLAQGTPEDILRDERVIAAYLGTGLKNKAPNGAVQDNRVKASDALHPEEPA